MMSVKVESSRRISLIPQYLSISLREARETFVAWIRLGEFVARTNEPIETKFLRLSEQWKDAVGAASDPADVKSARGFSDLVALGQSIIPFIMCELDSGNSFYWFDVLAEITGEDPTGPEDAGDVDAMIYGWKRWFDKNQ